MRGVEEVTWTFSSVKRWIVLPVTLISNEHLVDETLEGMEAAVLAGRFAGGRAYG